MGDEVGVFLLTQTEVRERSGDERWKGRPRGPSRIFSSLLYWRIRLMCHGQAYRQTIPARWQSQDARRTILFVADLVDRITVNVAKCDGRPCIRGMRIRVVDVLDLLATGLSQQQVLTELPDLELEDISACLRFASERLNRPILRG